MVLAVSAVLGTNPVPDTELQVSVQYISGIQGSFLSISLDFFIVLVTCLWQDEVIL